MARDIPGGFEEKKGASLFFTNLKKYIYGVAVGVVAVAVMLCISSFVLTANAIPDGMISAFAYFSVAVGAFFAGLTALRMLRSSGLVNGLITGAMMFLLQFILSLTFSGGKVFSLNTLIYLLINCLCAALGGITGVNMKRRFGK